MSTGDSEGPAWNKFWLSMDHETESMMSSEGGSQPPPTPDHRSAAVMSPEGQRPGVDRIDSSVLPGDSASHNGADMDEHSAFLGAPEDSPFTFKFKAPGGRVHRLAVTASAGLSELISVVAEKLGSEADSLGGAPHFEDGKMSHSGFALSYMDNEGDTVSITTDYDLLEAITMAREAHKAKVDLFVHHPEKPALPPTTEPQPAIIPPTPPESQIRHRKRFDEDEDEEMSSPTNRRKDRKPVYVAETKPQEQFITGVPNELLVPGALVVLGAVVVITFAIGRSSSGR